MNSKTILVLGGTGMLGHMVVKYIKSLPNFIVYSTALNKNNNEVYFDAYKNPEEIQEIIKKIKPELVINCIGIINKHVKDDNKEIVSFINSYFPHKLAKICKKNNSRLIHISTDCVFSGEEGNYNEESPYSPTDFYGLTKATGEVNDNHNLTIRTSIIGTEKKEPKTGLMGWFLKQQGKKIQGFKKAIWSGLTTLELAKKIIEMHERNITGIINIVSKPISKYDLLCLIKKIYNLNIEIEPEDNTYCDRSMKSKRADIDYKVPSHEEMLKELKEWENK